MSAPSDRHDSNLNGIAAVVDVGTTPFDKLPGVGAENGNTRRDQQLRLSPRPHDLQ